MSERMLSEIQSKLLQMFKWFDSFCRENNLKYYAVGGTFLGAVRHQGFIPWDDDIDVAMPREDYRRLEKLMSTDKIGIYILETQNSVNRDFCYPYTKLYDTTTTLIENCRNPLIRGIYIDIFPLDGVGHDEKQGLKWFKKINRENQFYLTRIAAIRKKRSFYKNLAIVISRLIPSFIVDDVKLRQSIDKKCGRYKLKESKLGGNLLGNWGERELIPVEVIGEPQGYKFEDIFIMGIENYDAYLTHIYGDWRKLPPKEKQVSHHDFLKLDLNQGYLELIEDDTNA